MAYNETTTGFIDQNVYFDPISGSDITGYGTITNPVQTYAKALDLVAEPYRKKTRIFGAAGIGALPSFVFSALPVGGTATPEAVVCPLVNQFSAVTTDLQRPPKLTAQLNPADVSAVVDSTAGLPASGTVLIGFESVPYTSTDATHFFGLTRGVNAATHLVGSLCLVTSSPRAATAGTTSQNIIDSAIATMRTGVAASITAIAGTGQAKTMTVTGMSGLTIDDVGKNFKFGLASSISSLNTGSTSVTLGAPTAAGAQTVSGLTGGSFLAGSVGNFLRISGAANPLNNGIFRITAFVSATSVTVFNPTGAAEGPTAAVGWDERGLPSHETGNNGVFKMASFISATSATFFNAQALVEATGLIYWQDYYRGATLKFLTGAAGVVDSGAVMIVDHGPDSVATVTITSTPVAGNTITINDGTNAPTVLTWIAAAPGPLDILIGANNTISAANLATVINSVLPTALRVRAFASGSSAAVKLVNMLAGSIGNTATPTQTGAWATIVTFTSGLAGTYTPTTTFTLITALGATPAVGNTFVVEKPGTTLQYTGSVQISGSEPFYMGIKFQALSSVSSLGWRNGLFTFYQVEFDGSINFQQSRAVAGAGFWLGDLALALPASIRIGFYQHNGTIQHTGGATFCPVVADSTSWNISVISLLNAAFLDAKRTTINCSLGGGIGLGGARLRGTLQTADRSIFFTASGATAVFFPGTSTTPVDVSYSSGYGMRVLQNKANLATVTGFGNALAGVLIKDTGEVAFDVNATNTVSITGGRGDVEFSALNTPNVRSWSTIRAVDAFGVGGYFDAYGNRADAGPL